MACLIRTRRLVPGSPGTSARPGGAGKYSRIRAAGWRSVVSVECRREVPMSEPTVRVPLSTIAHGRSGDKGNHANVAVIAYTPAGFDWLKANLTADVVAGYFAPLGPSRVERFE